MTIVARWININQDNVERLNRRCKQVWVDWEAYPGCPLSVDWYAEGRTSRLDTWLYFRVLNDERHELYLYLPDRTALAQLDIVRWLGDPLTIATLPAGAAVVYHYHPKLMAKPSWFKRLLNFFMGT